MGSMSKSKQQEALQFLDELDTLTPAVPPPKAAGGGGTQQPGDAADVLKFFDEISQKGVEPPSRMSSHLERPVSRAGTPTLRKTGERVRLGGGTPTTQHTSPPKEKEREREVQAAAAPAGGGGGGGGWGWGNVWSTASAALQQAKSVVDEQVKHLPVPPNATEQAKKWSEGVLTYVNKEHIERLGKDLKVAGMTTFTDILNAVAPPIQEHEVVSVRLSHDMEGFDGVDRLVYRSLARVMEQVEGDLVVNKADESRPKTDSGSSFNLNFVEGESTAVKLSEANLEELAKTKPVIPVTTSSIQNPTTYSHVNMRIQPFTREDSLSSNPSDPPVTNLHFLIQIADPGHGLVFSTVTQGVPAKWVGIWDKHDWVEDLVSESLRLGIELVGQQYIASRMRWLEEGEGQEEEEGEEEEEEEEEGGHA